MNEIEIKRPAGSKPLEDNNLWKNRFEIHSESSNRIYIVAQNKASGKFSCSCPGWISNRKCKHLISIGIPENQIHGREAFLLKKQERMR